MRSSKPGEFRRRKTDKYSYPDIEGDESCSCSEIERALWEAMFDLEAKGEDMEYLEKKFNIRVPSWYKKGRENRASQTSNQSPDDQKENIMADQKTNEQKTAEQQQQQQQAQAEQAAQQNPAAGASGAVKGFMSKTWDALTSPFSKGFMCGAAVGVGGTIAYNKYQDYRAEKAAASEAAMHE